MSTRTGTVTTVPYGVCLAGCACAVAATAASPSANAAVPVARMCVLPGDRLPRRDDAARRVRRVRASRHWSNAGLSFPGVEIELRPCHRDRLCDLGAVGLVRGFVHWSRDRTEVQDNLGGTF